MSTKHLLHLRSAVAATLGNSSLQPSPRDNLETNVTIANGMSLQLKNLKQSTKACQCKCK